MHRNVIQIANAKGGVGKTSLTANLAGVLAAAGWRVLCIDLDPQGNLSRHLGALAKTDQGAGLAESIRSGTPLRPIGDIRPGLELELVCSGSEWAAAVATETIHSNSLDIALQGVASTYDVVLLDCPPGEEALQQMAGRATRFLIIPTALNDSSIDGLNATFARAITLKQTVNPHLTVLGIVMFGVPSRASAWKERVRVDIASLVEGTSIEVFQHSIRDVPATAAAIEHAGVLIHEAEAMANSQSPWYKKEEATAVRFSVDTVRGLTEDYVALAQEIQVVLLKELALV